MGVHQKDKGGVLPIHFGQQASVVLGVRDELFQGVQVFEDEKARSESPVLVLEAHLRVGQKLELFVLDELDEVVRAVQEHRANLWLDFQNFEFVEQVPGNVRNRELVPRRSVVGPLFG